MSNRYAYDTATTIQINAQWCSGCGLAYGLPEGYLDARREDHKSWTCPNGCVRHFPRGKTDAQKLEEAQIRNTALQDQLTAAVADAETVRVALLRDRQRFANGVCPCCNRSFDNVRRHMSSKHPDYDVTKVKAAGTVKFPCSCGRSFETLRGLRTHQGHMRGDNWAEPSTSKTAYWGGAHLTRV